MLHYSLGLAAINKSILEKIYDSDSYWQKDSPELPGWQEVVGPLLVVPDSDVEPGHDDADLVDSASQVDDDLAATVVVDDLELADVPVLLHRLQEFDDDLRARSDQNLALAALLGVRDGLEAVREDLW